MFVPYIAQSPPHTRLHSETLSRKKKSILLKKIYNVMLRIILLVVVMFVFGCNAERRKVYLFPDKYQGVAVILFGQSDGENPQRENGSEIYHMRENGILKLKEDASTGWIKESFFYVDSNRSRIEIPYYTAMDVRDKGADKSKIICYNSERGSTTDTATNKEKRFQVMLITSIGNLDSIANKRSSVLQTVLK